MPQKLKLSKDTVAVLKNFNSINPMLYVKKGNVISTISEGKTIFSKYQADENFKTDFGIYNLGKLLSVMSFFSDPELVINENYLTIKSKNQQARIVFANPDVLVYPKKDMGELPSVEAEFDITEDEINMITKAYSGMGMPCVSIESDGEKILLKALDPAKPDSDTYTIEIGEDGGNGTKFTALFKVTNLRMIPADYRVQVSSKGIAAFRNRRICYWLAVEKDSTFG